MTAERLAQYCREVLALKHEYQGRMAVYLGLELDSMSVMPAAGQFEYLIGSVHNLQTPVGRVYPIDAAPADTAAAIAEFGGVAAYVQAYFAAVDEMLNSRPVDICGHFDLICKYNAGGRFFAEDSLEYKKSAAGVLRRHCRKGAMIRPVFEINTGGMCRGYLRRPYPDYWLWEILRDEEAWVMVNSDAHAAADLAFQLAEQRAAAEKFGLKVVTIDEILGY